MKRNYAIIFIAIFSVLLPETAAAQNLSRAELLDMASQRGTCGERAAVDAYYSEDGRILVVCGDPEGFVPVVGALGLGAGAAAAAGVALLGAAAGGGGGSAPPSTD